MTIGAYRFGEIEIEGRVYTSDVIITPDHVVDTWWRKEGHRLAVADLGDVVAAKPDIVVVGTGYLGAWPSVTTRVAISRHTASASARPGPVTRPRTSIICRNSTHESSPPCI